MKSCLPLPDIFRLGCVQFDVLRGDWGRNAETVTRLLMDAARKDCRMVVLPEMWSVSFAGEALLAEADRLSERLAFLSSEARRHQIWLAAGTLPEPATETRVFNTFFLLDPEGEVRWTFRKVHLFPNSTEPRWFCPGNILPEPVTIGSWIIGGGICYDLRMPELFRWQMKQQANLFLLPAQFPDPRLEHFTLFCRARALENLAFFAGVNRIGQEGSLAHSGGSIVADPFGRVLGQMGKEEGILTVDLDVSLVRETRRQNPFLATTPALDSWVEQKPLVGL